MQGKSANYLNSMIRKAPQSHPGSKHDPPDFKHHP